LPQVRLARPAAAKERARAAMAAGTPRLNAHRVTPGTLINYQVGAPITTVGGVGDSWFGGTSISDASVAARNDSTLGFIGDSTTNGGTHSSQTAGDAAKFGLLSWTQTSDGATAAPGSGGATSAGVGNPGSLYGGGGGGGAAGGFLGGDGAQGIIVLTYTAAAVATTTPDTHDPGFYPSEALKRLRERRERDVVERAEDRKVLLHDLERAFGLIEEAAEELGEEHAEAVAEVTAARAEPDIDWSALASEMARIEAVMLAAEKAQTILMQREQARLAIEAGASKRNDNSSGTKRTPFSCSYYM
jgi:hypothetical protein